MHQPGQHGHDSRLGLLISAHAARGNSSRAAPGSVKCPPPEGETRIEAVVRMDVRSNFIFRMAREERGVALPVALSILFLVAGLTSIAAKAGIVSDHFSFRDRNAKRAVQAASAGIEAAIYQLNLMQPANARVRDQGRQHRRAEAHARGSGQLVHHPDRGPRRRRQLHRAGVQRRDPARQRTGDRAAQDRVDRHGQRHQAAGGGHDERGNRGSRCSPRTMRPSA